MFYYVKNLQGDIVKILDEDGNEKADYVYNAWGDIISQSDDELASKTLFVIVVMCMMKIPLFIISKPGTMPQLLVDLSMLMILHILVLLVLLLVQTSLPIARIMR